ncbi:helix-turn-helix domain-containing protein [Bacillus thuringiensis]|uniref:helix-turn-helix domain-containing protein n=1 Tax=Bacillus thuringiensis TaxID=1428 RepID=UPI003D3509C9
MRSTQNNLVELRKVINPSTVNEMCKENIKRVNIETLAKVSDYFKKNDIRELFVTIIEDEENAE